MTKVVVIKFKNGGKLYYFSPRQGEVYERNMPSSSRRRRGLEFAWVAYSEREVEDKEVVQPLKPIIRIATQRDQGILCGVRGEEAAGHAGLQGKNSQARAGDEADRLRIHLRRHKDRLLFHFRRQGGFQRACERPCLRLSYPYRAQAGGHAGRNEISRRNRSLRTGLLLCGQYARIQKGEHQNGQNAGPVPESGQDQRPLRAADVLFKL